MLTYISAFFSGELDPLLTHIVLLAGAILAEFSVAAGIVLESPHEKAFREKVGMALVLGGVLVSAIFTIALFVFDEGISRSQQEKIVALETRIAPRSLTGEQQARMVDALKPFAGLVVHLIVYPPDIEGQRLAKQLQDVLKLAGMPTPYGPHICWRENGTNLFDSVTGVYIAAGDRPPLADQFGDAFARSLTSAGIEAQRGHLVHCELPFGDVEVVVGLKPVAGDPPWNDGALKPPPNSK